MKKLSFPSISIQFVNKAVQDAIRRCERIVVVGSSDECKKIYFFIQKKNYYRYYSIDLDSSETTVPKRFQLGTRSSYEEVLRSEPSAKAVNRLEASRLINTYSSSQPSQVLPAGKSNMALVHWVKGLLVS